VKEVESWNEVYQQPSCPHLYPEIPMTLVRWLRWVAMPFRSRSAEGGEVGQQAGGVVDSLVCNGQGPTDELQERKTWVES